MITPKATTSIEMTIEESTRADKLKEKGITRIAIFRKGLEQYEKELN